MKSQIERFIRDTLGCGCPPEVLEHIEDEHLPGPPCPRRRIAVGGRLLIYLVTLPAEGSAEELLAEVVAAGRSERDRLAMNRFRLVVATADPEAVEPTLVRVFERLRDGDERLHLHVLPLTAPGSFAL